MQCARAHMFVSDSVCHCVCERLTERERADLYMDVCVSHVCVCGWGVGGGENVCVSVCARERIRLYVCVCMSLCM